MNNNQIFVKKLNPNAKIPTFAHEDDACSDLYSDSNFIINPNKCQTHMPTLSLLECY